MSEYLILKAVDHDKLPVKFRKQYPTAQSLVDAGWWVQRKYDGCMGIATIKACGDHTMQSRTGEDYTISCASILDELAEAADDLAPGWDDFVVIGEVWKRIEVAAFPAISGAFRKRKLDPELRFMCNDLLAPEMVTTHPYSDRFSDLCKLLPPMEYERSLCHTVMTHRTFSKDVMAYALELQGAGGYDGAILRDPYAGYNIGTVKAGEIVKVKPTLSLDLHVQTLITDTGGKTGRMVYTIDVVYNDVITTVGSGMPHKLDDCPVPGQIAEIECLGITADGKLREPRFKGIRHDKLKAD